MLHLNILVASLATPRVKRCSDNNLWSAAVPFATPRVKTNLLNLVFVTLRQKSLRRSSETVVDVVLE